MKLKRGGAYVDASPFVKRGGVYVAVSAFVKTQSGYVSAFNEDQIAPPLDLGDLTVDTGFVVSSAELLAGATDPDGDALTVTSVTAVSGGTIFGAGPWTITPTVEGAGSAVVTIIDGRGGSVARTVTWNGVAASADYSEFLQWSSSVLGDDLIEFANLVAKTANEDLP